VSSVSSRRRRPQPSSKPKIARSRLPFKVAGSGSCQSVRASSTVNQFPSRHPSFFAPFTRRMPAAADEAEEPAFPLVLVGRGFNLPASGRPARRGGPRHRTSRKGSLTAALFLSPRSTSGGAASFRLNAFGLSYLWFPSSYFYVLCEHRNIFHRGNVPESL
jgi:hypothetical protein